MLTVCYHLLKIKRERGMMLFDLDSYMRHLMGSESDSNDNVGLCCHHYFHVHVFDFHMVFNNLHCCRILTSPSIPMACLLQDSRKVTTGS